MSLTSQRETPRLSGADEIDPVCQSVKDLWRMVDKEGTPEGVISLELMNAAKVRKQS